MRTGSCTLPFLGRCTLRVVLRCISTTTKHLHFNAVYFGGVALDLLAVSPLPGAVAPFEIDLGALFQVLTSDFRQTTFRQVIWAFGRLECARWTAGRLSHVKVLFLGIVLLSLDIIL